MKKLEVEIKSKSKNYPIWIGGDLINQIASLVDLAKYSKLFIISETNVAPLYLSKLKQALGQYQTYEFIFDAGEENKNLETVKNAYLAMLKAGLDRKALVINLGGGVTTDMGGFAASTFKRGIDFLNISTTVEGMVDASIGGKVGVNLEKYKNFVGNFAHPIGVIMDVDTLKTLDERNIVAGFAEILKHGLIADTKYFDYVVSKPAMGFDGNEMIEITQRSCEIKADVVSQDEKEGGLRKILNFGHTVGHAIESFSLKTSEPLLHGEAVALGMIVESKISHLIGMLTSDEFNKITNGIEKSGLPTKYNKAKLEDLTGYMAKDKKNEANKIKWTLIRGIGKCEWDIEVDSKIVEQAYQTILN